MIVLKETELGIYYIHDYIAVRNFHLHSEDEVAISKKIWDYKKIEGEALQEFTNQLMEAITLLSKNIKTEKIGLVAVPPSKVDKQSAIRTSIWNIEDWYHKGITRSFFGCNKIICDYRDLLVRTKDISTAHEGQRSSYIDQYESIKCQIENLSIESMTFIILDDVTTMGTSMNVCRDILIAHGADESSVFRLSISKTVWE